MTDVSVYYFIRRNGPAGEEALSKRRATLETIMGKGTAVMPSRRIVDHTEVDANGFLVGGADDDSHAIGELWSRIRSLESRARSRGAEALEIADAASGRKALLLLESAVLREEAQTLRDGMGRVSVKSASSDPSATHPRVPADPAPSLLSYANASAGS